MKNNNQTILVSGCTRGIGRAVCELFAASGFNVCGYARSKADCEKMQETFSRQYADQAFLFVSCDAAQKKDVEAFAQHALDTFGHIDIMVNNAGVFVPGNIHNEQDGTLERLIETNLYSAYYLTRALLPQLMQQKKGHIFNICSVASIKPYENGGSYCISKFALLGFSKQLREEMKPHGIRVTALMPGATLTDSWSGSGFPESRFIAADDIAKTILSVYQLSTYTDVEELVIRPQLGDI